jgi:hypothetical protein
LPTIRFEVTNEGKVRAVYEGFGGETCIAAAEKIAAELKAMGVEQELQECQQTTGNVVRERGVTRLG